LARTYSFTFTFNFESSSARLKYKTTVERVRRGNVIVQRSPAAYVPVLRLTVGAQQVPAITGVSPNEVFGIFSRYNHIGFFISWSSYSYQFTRRAVTPGNY